MRYFAKTRTILALLLAVFSASSARANEITDALSLKMKYLSQSQSVISKNLANSNTPGYKTMEVQEPRYKNGASGGLTMATTSPNHIGGINHSASFKTQRQKDVYETAPNGNNVSIEQQMVKMAQNSAEHQAAVNVLGKMKSIMGLARGDGK